MSRQTDFEQFYCEHYLRLFLYAKRLTRGDDEVCRDIVGDALMQAWARIDHIETDKLKKYVYTLIHSKSVDYVRRMVAANRYADFYLYLCKELSDEEDWEEHEQQVSLVLQLFDKLSNRTRYVLEQCYFEKRRYADVAQELGISVNGVKKHIVKALKILREAIQEKNN